MAKRNSVTSFMRVCHRLPSRLSSRILSCKSGESLISSREKISCQEQNVLIMWRRSWLFFARQERAQETSSRSNVSKDLNTKLIHAHAREKQKNTGGKSNFDLRTWKRTSERSTEVAAASAKMKRKKESTVSARPGNKEMD